MTPNSITSAAYTEAAYRDMDPGPTGENNRAWFVAGAEWGYDQALTQEPTDAEVLAAMTAYEGHPDRVSAWRAALSAVLSIRRNEEKR